MWYFYPRSPCGERPSILHKILADWGFLSTLSLRRATPEGPAKLPKRIDFYPRSPCGERPYSQALRVPRAQQISIHALLAESDSMLTSLFCGCFDFYPRSPCGERPRRLTHHLSTYRFLSTLSLRRATPPVDTSSVNVSISIHALLAESDLHH